jgi:tape measure domain-containing protein
MTDFARLVLASDTTGLRDARGELNRLTQTGAQTEGRVNRSMAAMGASFRSVAVQAASMVAAFAGVGAALRSSQEIVGITNGLRAMGMSTAEAERALDQIASVAQRTRAPLRETAELYRRVSVASRDMGASQEDVLRFTENVGLALAASGTSAREASGALLQLSQAMAGGVVRAEEFNSILEGAFPIAQAAADGIDGAAGSVGRLRQMVVAGEVSSREFFEAILSQSDALEEAFARTVPTISQAMTVLAGAVGLAAFGFDDATGISEALARSILGLAQSVRDASEAIGSAKGALDDFLSSIVPFGGEVDSLRVLVSGAAVAIGVAYRSAIISATIATGGWIASLVTLRGVLVATGIGALVVAAGTMIDFLLRLRSATGSWGEALSALGDLAAGVWEGIKTSAQSIAPAIGAVWRDIQAGFFSMLSSLTEMWSSFLSTLGADVAGVPGLGAISDRLGEAAGGAFETVSKFDAKARAAERAAAGLRNEASNLATQGFDKAREAAERLSEILSAETDATDEARREAENLKRAIDEMGTSAGGKAADNLAKASDGLRDFEDGSKRAADRFGDLAASVITGSRSMSDVLSQLGNQLLSSGISGLFGNIFGGTGIGNLFAGFFDQGGVIPSGQFAIAGERGPEIVTGPARVTSRADTARIMGGGARVSVPIQVNIQKGAERDEVRRRRGPSGQEIIDVAVSDSISGGRQDTVFGARFGAQPQTVRR